MRFRFLFIYMFAGALGGGLFYLSLSIQGGGMIGENLIKCVGCGLLGGLVPGLLREGLRRHVPFLQSWTALTLLIFAMPFIFSLSSLYWQAFVLAILPTYFVMVTPKGYLKSNRKVILDEQNFRFCNHIPKRRFYWYW